MTGKYIEKLVELMEELEKSAVQGLSNSNVISDRKLLDQIKYLAGYIETLKDEIL